MIRSADKVAAAQVTDRAKVKQVLVNFIGWNIYVCNFICKGII